MKERDGEGEGGRVDRTRGEKKEWQCSVFGAPVHFFLTAGIKHDIFGGKKKQLRERNARLPALSGIGAVGKPQHRRIMGNHRHKLPKVNPIIRETLSCTHIPHILAAQSPALPSAPTTTVCKCMRCQGG